MTMNNDRIYLLTGAAGFLGSNICLQLLQAGCKVRALVLPMTSPSSTSPVMWK